MGIYFSSLAHLTDLISNKSFFFSGFVDPDGIQMMANFVFFVS